MAAYTLHKAFRQLNIHTKDIISSHYTAPVARTRTVNIVGTTVQVDRQPLTKALEEHVTFGLRSIGLTYQVPKGELPLRKIIESPLKPNFVIDNPVESRIEKGDIAPNKIIEVPMTDSIIEKQAERMIVIRRRKMKKHKRKKWLKKFKFVIRKRRQRKKNLKEKAFQAELQEILAKAEKFSAEQYVAERLHILTRERLPNKWRGELLPEDMIRQFIKEKQDRIAHKVRQRTYRLKLDDESV